MTRLPLAALLLAPVVAQAQAASIAEVPEITEGLIATAIAYEIGRVCGPVDGRRLQGIAFLLSLQSRARSLGFSQEEIDAYVEDEAEKARLEGIARERLTALGAVEGDEESFCAVGRTEMARGSQVGRLLSE